MATPLPSTSFFIRFLAGTSGSLELNLVGSFRQEAWDLPCRWNH